MKASPDETLTIIAPFRVLRCGRNCWIIRTGPAQVDVDLARYIFRIAVFIELQLRMIPTLLMN